MLMGKLLFLFLIVSGLMVSGLLAACGDAAGVVVEATARATAAPATASSPATTPTQAGSSGQAASGVSGQTTPGSSAPAATAPAATGTGANPASLDPCSLFTKEDFKAVFNKEANDPDQWEGVCDFQFADTLVPGSDEAFGLTFRLDNQTYTLDKFTQRARQLRFQQIDGVSDAAYLKPSQSEDESSVLMVLKGNLSFALELLQPAAVTADQRVTELKAAAQKVLAHLAAPAPAAAKTAPTAPASRPGSGYGPTPTPTPAAGSSAKVAAYDPCQLFTKADFAAVLSSQPQAPQKDEDVAAYSCNYQSATTEDTLSLYLQKEAYDKARFESEWKDQTYTTTTTVKGLGDEAVWTDGSVSRLYVLKGQVVFWFELTLENDKTPDQKLEILQKGAEKVLGVLK